jgi:hypothetical protein
MLHLVAVARPFVVVEPSVAVPSVAAQVELGQVFLENKLVYGEREV